MPVPYTPHTHPSLLLVWSSADGVDRPRRIRVGGRGKGSGALRLGSTPLTVTPVTGLPRTAWVAIIAGDNGHGSGVFTLIQTAQSLLAHLQQSKRMSLPWISRRFN